MNTGEFSGFEHLEKKEEGWEEGRKGEREERR